MNTPFFKIAAKPVFAVERVTPEMATQWLSTALHNRKLRPSKVRAYAEDMRCGRWTMNGESIKFDTAGHLLNGQHRLNAVIKSGATVEMATVRGLDPSTQATMDRGLSAKSYDWAKGDHIRAVHGVVRALLTMANPGRSTFTRWEIEDAILKVGLPMLQDAVTEGKSKPANRPSVRAGLVLIDRVDPARTKTFVQALEDFSTTPQSPESALLRAIGVGSSTRKKHHQRTEVLLVARAVLAVIQGQKMTNLRPPSEEQMADLFSKVGLDLSLAPANVSVTS